jgi:hypothetical protein
LNFIFFLNCLNRINNQLVEMEHFSSLLAFENAIMCQSLEGLYKSLDCLIGHESASKKMMDEFSIIIRSFQSISQEFKSLSASLTDNIRQKDDLLVSFSDFEEKKASFEETKAQLVRNFKDSMSVLKNELNEAQTDQSRLKIENIDLEKRLKNLLTELTALRSKSVKFSSTLNRTLALDQVCQNCRVIFKESENFNWSCRQHPSKFSGTVYWCCGKTDKNALGCTSSKHVSCEDGQMTENASFVFCSVKFRQNCKQKGHSSGKCPKDPNFKSGVEIEDERNRLLQINEKKGRGFEGNYRDGKFKEFSIEGTPKSEYGKEEFQDLIEIKEVLAFNI